MRRIVNEQRANRDLLYSRNCAASIASIGLDVHAVFPLCAEPDTTYARFFWRSNGSQESIGTSV
jgi:hypothetical protein